jgi:alanyl-tRNA synthetase
MVEIGEGEYSRELCGGTHVRSTAEIGVFHVVSETSSAAPVRRIEAITGPTASALLRQRNRLLEDVATVLRTDSERVPETVHIREQERRAIEKAAGVRAARVPAMLQAQVDTGAGLTGGTIGGADLDALVASAEQIDGALVLASAVQAADAKALLGMLDRVKARLPEAAIVLGSAAEGRVHLIASAAPALVARGVKAGAIVKAAAAVVGGGGGGRDTMAQAGGRDPERLPEAIAAGRGAIAAALRGEPALTADEHPER